ncbi:uncharacterized protein CIMG_12310 [Coccidioides immitis RS]|uniref:Uncharacterized protein n=3 Tax=Coccidioides immitis TaxID=5501 RepID=A0A0D8JWN2_COCIM|nr:uncharacterized protein CIMG_12310 [Coccidioides immitis RS]KJF61346.1 hypothetical protein CIMG_12310 [Coccidioides immitis RS]KMP08820.1 hypothetical protein CIRG_08501 [Coccidioides immitis RMSCC 2394]KMU87952.1 hypothetical protein CIHG_05719 [Coccidioides immitis H538.4]TPX20679.1 hypothetical protein DIZ76_016574 [Coccidioides immitis]
MALSNIPAMEEGELKYLVSDRRHSDTSGKELVKTSFKLKGRRPELHGGQKKRLELEYYDKEQVESGVEKRLVLK